MEQMQSDYSSYFQTLKTNKTNLFADSDQLMKDCMQMFFDGYNGHLERIEQAIERKDFKTIKEAVHKFKGSLKLFSDESLIHLCKTLENSALDQNVNDIPVIYEKLSSEVNVLYGAMQEFNRTEL